MKEELLLLVSLSLIIIFMGHFFVKVCDVADCRGRLRGFFFGGRGGGRGVLGKMVAGPEALTWFAY